MDRRALDPHFVFGDLDVVNARALARIELAGLQGAEQQLGFERFGFDHDIAAEGVEVAVVEVRVVAGDRHQPPILVAQLVEQVEPVAPIGQDRAGVIIDLDRMRGAERTPVLDRQLRPRGMGDGDESARLPRSLRQRGALSSGSAGGKSNGSPVATICQYSPAVVAMA